MSRVFSFNFLIAWFRRGQAVGYFIDLPFPRLRLRFGRFGSTRTRFFFAIALRS